MCCSFQTKIHQQQQKEIEQLKREAAITRIKVSEAIRSMRVKGQSHFVHSAFSKDGFIIFSQNARCLNSAILTEGVARYFIFLSSTIVPNSFAPTGIRTHVSSVGPSQYSVL